MKKILLILLLSLALLGGCQANEEPEAPPTPDPPPETVKTIQVGSVVDALLVNVRLGPSTDTRIIDTARRGAMFLIEAKTEGGSWCQISIRGDTAYISADYLYLQTFKQGEDVVVGTVSGADSVNIRSSADPSSDLVFSAGKNERFIITAVDYVTGWHQLTYKGEPAYVSSEFISLTEGKIEDMLW